jgi:chromosome segregation ATPase
MSSNVSKPTGKKVVTKEAPDTDSDGEDGEDVLLSSISDAIPNLHLLLDKYKKAHGQMDKRQRLLQKLEGRFMEILKSKDETIQRLIHQAEDSALSQADKIRKLKSRIEELEMANDDMMTELTTHQHRHQEAEERANRAEEAIVRLGKEKDQILNDRKLFSEAAKADKDKTVAAMRMLLTDEFNEQKQRMQDQYNNEIKDLEDQLMQTEKKLSQEFDDQKKAITDGHNDTEASMKSQISSLEEKLAGTSKTYDEIKEELKEEWKGEKEELEKKHEEEITQIKEKHQEYINDQIKGFVSLQEILNKRYTVENEDLRKQLEGIRMALPPAPSVEDAPEAEGKDGGDGSG